MSITQLVQPLDESQGPSQSHGHGLWLVCEMTIIHLSISFKLLAMYAYSGRPCQLYNRYNFWMRTKGPHNYMETVLWLVYEMAMHYTSLSPYAFNHELFPSLWYLNIRFETTLKYQMMAERYPNLKEEVGGSIPGCEISSLIDGKLARWSTASCALALTCQPSISKRKRKRKRKSRHVH